MGSKQRGGKKETSKGPSLTEWNILLFTTLIPNYPSEKYREGDMLGLVRVNSDVFVPFKTCPTNAPRRWYLCWVKKAGGDPRGVEVNHYGWSAGGGAQEGHRTEKADRLSGRNSSLGIFNL